MTVSLNNPVRENSATLASYTPSGPAGTRQVLIVIIGTEDVGSDDQVTGVDFDPGTPQALTNAYHFTSVLSTNENELELWYLINPGTTAGSITVTGGERVGFIAATLLSDTADLLLDSAITETATDNVATVTHTHTPANNNGIIISSYTHATSTAWVLDASSSGTDFGVSAQPSSNRTHSLYEAYTTAALVTHGYDDDGSGAERRQCLGSCAFYESAGAATNPKGPLGHPLAGPFGGPI